MSQDLLSSTTAYLAYGYVGGGTSQLRGALNYYGLAPKFELGFNYGGGWQSLYGFLSEEQVPRRKKYFDLSLKVSLPMTLSSGYHTRTLTPYAELRHINALIWENDRSETGYQRLVAGLLFSDNVRMATRDFLPRWGYALRFSTVSAPFRGGFGRILSLYGRVYLPGLMPHHSLMLRGNLQRQTASDYMFYYKELYPRGAGYDYVASRYASVTADYQFPVWCPDGGINSIVYFTRIRMNLYFDCARYQEKRATMAGPYYPMRSVNSYGGEILVRHASVEDSCEGSHARRLCLQAGRPQRRGDGNPFLASALTGARAGCLSAAFGGARLPQCSRCVLMVFCRGCVLSGRFVPYGRRPIPAGPGLRRPPFDAFVVRYDLVRREFPYVRSDRCAPDRQNKRGGGCVLTGNSD